MYEFLSKKGTLIAFVVGAVISLAHVAMTNGFLGLNAGVALVGVGFLAMLFGIIKYFIDNPKNVKSVLGFIAIFAIVAVLIMIASGEPTEYLRATVEKHGVTPGQLKYVSGSVTAAVVLLAVSFFLLFASEIYSLFK